MSTQRSGHLVLISLLAFSLSSCGGGNGGSSTGGNSGNGGSTTPTTTEILYAQNFGNSIFAFNIDLNSGALTQTTTATIPATMVDGTSIAITPSGNFLYATTGDSGIAAYSANSSGQLSLLSGSPFPNTTNISGFTIDPAGKFLYASDDSAVVGYSIGTSGSLTSISGGPFSSPGNGGPPGSLTIDPTGKFLYGSASFDSTSDPNGGLNIWGFTINSQTGALTSMPGSPFATQDNSQPAGIAIDPSGKFLYVALFNISKIAAFTIDSTTGALVAVPGSPFATEPDQPGFFTQTSELSITPSGKFLYAFNFDGNTISAFTIDPTSGALTPMSGSPFLVNPGAEGGMAIDPSGKFLYLTIAFGGPSAFDIFNIDPNTGALAPNANSPVAGNELPMSLVIGQFH
jgi:6-phosphogluconolactonase